MAICSMKVGRDRKRLTEFLSEPVQNFPVFYVTFLLTNPWVNNIQPYK